MIRSRARMNRRPWTDEDDAIVIENFGKMIQADIARLLGRSYDSVKARVKCLDLTEAPDHDPTGFRPSPCRVRIMSWAIRLRRNWSEFARSEGATS